MNGAITLYGGLFQDTYAPLSGEKYLYRLQFAV